MISNEKLFDSKAPSFSWKARLKSFVYAWEGIVSFFRWEHNAQIHLVITFLVLVLSVTLGVIKWEAIAVVFSIAFVWVAEMVNTAIEKTIDFVSMERDPQIKLIKDIAAGAVLIASLAAVVVGLFIFIPKLLAL
ncbi:MAG TPA: diacylglycerol kinase family protein [Flavisolibacter sp.]|nr:diacylglycerol kinase family protein [Flavisolibacter sp.]